jgi:eukaryotic-like serine/threonine-protein kinase
MGTEADPLLGTLVDDRYKVLEAMAAGSMGSVYRAEREPVGKIVAIKFLHSSFAKDREFQDRFDRETRVMSKLAHPNCVSVVDFGVWEESPYIVMEFVAGTTLRDMIDKGPIEPTRALNLVRQIAAGLAHAHQRGIVHRDVKPANVMITEEIGTGEHVRILDFGLARLRGGGSRDATQSNVVVGTPNYMAPEQTVGGGIIDARTDIYAVGVVLFEMIAGERPFQAEDTLALLGMHRAAPIPQLADRVPKGVVVPDGVQAIIDRAMAKSPADRYQSAIDLASAIDEIIGTQLSGKHRLPTEKSGRTKRKPSNSSSAAAIAPTMLDLETSNPKLQKIAKRRTSKVPAVLMLLVLGGGAAAAAWYVKRDSGKDAQTATNPAQGNNEGSAPAGSGSADPGSGGMAVGSSTGNAPDLTSGTFGTSGTSGTSGMAGSGSSTGAPATDVGSGSAIADVGSASSAGSGSAITDVGPGSNAGSAAGSSAGSATEIDIAVDPASVETPEPTPKAAAAEDEAADAPKTAAEVEKRAPAPPAPTLATTIDGALALIKDGKRDLALASLRQIWKNNPKSAYIPFLLGNLYYDNIWWGVAMDHYALAIQKNAGYKYNATLNRNIIRMLASKKTSGRAEYFLRRTIGRPSVPYLQQAARYESNATVKRYAAYLAKQIR